LRSAGETFGLIQLNDHRRARFSPELIATYRRTADYVAGFLAKRQAREALRKSETHLRTLLNTIPDLIWLKDPDGVYLSCNHRFERFFGAAKAEIVGKTDYDFVDKGLADFFKEKDKAAMAAGRPSINEEEVIFADDGYRELLETIRSGSRRLKMGTLFRCEALFRTSPRANLANSALNT
jgi:PAS domain S-box-containing protein